jgi:hypothetical protein
MKRPAKRKAVTVEQALRVWYRARKIGAVAGFPSTYLKWKAIDPDSHLVREAERGMRAVLKLCGVSP